MTGPSVLMLACGALAKELVELKRLNHWTHVKLHCLPAELHNTPGEIPTAVAEQLAKYREQFDHMFVAYADCGTGGMLDEVLAEFGVERLPGAHCYEFFSGSEAFQELADAEPGTFYLTDFLNSHFDRLVIKGLRLDEHPELMPFYFGNYRRLVYLSQRATPKLESMARQHAEYLGLQYMHKPTGLDNVALDIREHIVQWQCRRGAARKHETRSDANPNG